MQQEDQTLYEKNLYTYYKHLFPIQQIVDWLSYEYDNEKESKYLLRRELSFERSIGDQDPIYQRYQSFPNALTLQQCLLEEQNKQNIYQSSSFLKYDIGAVFDKQPKKGEKLKALEKEVVIDIDMDAYDEVRNCCQGAKICDKCWKFLKVACEILNPALYEDFGFQYILAIYSGRRGIHLWICDHQVRTSQNDVRAALISYLNINIGNADASEIIKSTDKTKIELLHPAIQRAYNIANNSFIDIILRDQNGLVKENVKKKMITILRRKNLLNPKIEKAITTLNDSYQIWEQIINIKVEDNGSLDVAKLEIVLMCLYPRLDANVSTTINHLLKGPFSIHPKTQRVCVPFLLKESDKFNPLDAPTLPEILNQLGQISNDLKQRKNDKELYPFLGKQIPSLTQYINLFEEFIYKYNNRAILK